MESSKTQTWQSMQNRIENIRKRQAFIPQANRLKKELLIVKMQIAKMEEKALDNLYSVKKQELSRKVEELNIVRAQYHELADKELCILESNLEIIRQQQYDPTVYSLDLEEYQSSLGKAITLLKEEQEGVRSDKANAAMARGDLNDASLDNHNNSII
jgi:hypothetical protein